MEAGLQPHIVACRCPSPVTDKVRQKISMFSNVPLRRVFSMHDMPSIYLVPEMLREAGMDREVLTLLGLHERVNQRNEDQARRKWQWFVERLLAPKEKTVNIAVTGKYTSVRDAYASIDKALEHCGAHAQCRVNIQWIDTSQLNARNVADALRGCHAVLCPGGFGSRGAEGKIECVRFARENNIPYLGICLGFQMAVVEFARHVCGLANANTTEFDAHCQHPVIDVLPEQKKIEGLGGNMRLGGKDVILKPGSRVSELYGAVESVRLRFRHRYEVEPKYIDQLERGGLIFSGHAPHQPIMQMLELPESMHPYFMATQAHPCLTSRPLTPDPLFLGLVKAALVRAYPQQVFSTMTGGKPTTAADSATTSAAESRPTKAAASAAL